MFCILLFVLYAGCSLVSFLCVLSIHVYFMFALFCRRAARAARCRTRRPACRQPAEGSSPCPGSWRSAEGCPSVAVQLITTQVAPLHTHSPFTTTHSANSPLTYPQHSTHQPFHTNRTRKHQHNTTGHKDYHYKQTIPTFRHVPRLTYSSKHWLRRT